ncbi:GNAT family N-acetyltransferase [Veronia pacifica]|nr:GNAT family N-acetyltransferase [Veronia pacifica]
MRHILLDSMSTENIEKYLASDYQYIGAFNEKSEIVGVAAIRGGTHLYHLFVRDDYQGNGLSRQLWQQIKYEVIDEKHPGRFTVNSSVNAESVYLKLGFQRMDGIRNRNGMVDIPMVLEPA